ncbi:MAG: lipoprotein N-acyltransferase Lnb domain-containing protein, partial [Burkholderiales bacterium]
MRRITAVALFVLLGLLIEATGGWGVLALAYSGPHNEVLRNSLSAAVALIAQAALIALGVRRWRWRVLSAYIVLFAVLLVWYFGIEPSNDREWQADVAVLPYATVEGDIVTVHDIRNFDYRSEADYTPAYYDKRFDVRELEGVDLVAVYWMGPAIAHTFVSFAFAGGDHLAISIETRKEKGEAYSTVKGFFRQYELYYVVADERDVIRLRTNYRHDPPEEVYVYRVQGP